MIRYMCGNCDFRGSFMSERKKCPCCNKHTLYIPDESEVESKPTKGKTKPINPRAARFDKNTFVDDGKLCKEDRKLTAKLNKIGTVSPRIRGKANNIKECERCSKDFKSYTNEYLCPKCILKTK